MRTILLMIITPSDIAIAKYCVASIIPALSDEVKLKLFFNGVNPVIQNNFLSKLKSNKNLFFKSNYSFISKNFIKISSSIGSVFQATNKQKDFREGAYETSGEIWSRELILEKDYDLVGIIDADFELFDCKLLQKFQSFFLAEPRLAFFSSDYSPLAFNYEHYSKRNLYISERYHTWFCVYRRAALKEESDCFPFEEKYLNDILVYDHSALLQKKLINLGWYGKSLKEKKTGGVVKKNMYIHYGAFSKNYSLGGQMLKFYRYLRIGIHNGYIHVHKQKLFAAFIRVLSKSFYLILRMSRFDKERLTFNFKVDKTL